MYLFSLSVIIASHYQKIFFFHCKYSDTNRHSLYKLQTWVKHYNVDTHSQSTGHNFKDSCLLLLDFFSENYFMYYI